MKFFVLQDPKAGCGDAVTDYLPIDGSKTGNAPRCAVCEKFSGMMPLLPPVRLELEAWGSRWGDVAFGPGDQILISEKAKKQFTDAGLGGFISFDPVEIVKTKRRKSRAGVPPHYWLASIQRGRAVLDETASHLVRDETPMCQECHMGGMIRQVSRIVLKVETWSGEDVFFARGLPGTILVSERFKHVCENSNLANCSLVTAEEFGFDHYPQEHIDVRGAPS